MAKWRYPKELYEAQHAEKLATEYETEKKKRRTRSRIKARHTLPSDFVLSEQAAILSEGSPVYRSKKSVRAIALVTDAGIWHFYEHDLIKNLSMVGTDDIEFASLDIGTLERSTRLLWRAGYRGRTRLSAQVIYAGDEDGEIMGLQWITIVWGINPSLAWQQIAFKIRSWEIKTGLRYGVSESVAKLVWQVEEPKWLQKKRREEGSKSRGSSTSRLKTGIHSSLERSSGPTARSKSTTTRKKKSSRKGSSR